MRIACFGEILIRFSAANGARLVDAGLFESHVGGAEANVACALAALGHEVTMASVVPDSELGRRAIGELRRSGVDTAAIHLTSGRMGLYFWEKGAGRRSAQIVYDRAGSTFACAPFPFACQEDLLQNCRLLHVSGISLALSDASQACLLGLIGEAQARGIIVSFDCNFRPSLWAARGIDPRGPLREAIGMCDILFASHKDMALILNWQSRDQGLERRRAAALAAFEAFPNLRMIASTAREIVDDHMHRITGRMDFMESAHSTAEIAIGGIVDRIGTGDAFVAGILDGRIRGTPPDETLARSMALMELKHGTAGDFTRFTQNDVTLMLMGQSDIRR